jgi:hypothetical protein
MRPFPLSLVLLLAACTDTAPRPPPTDRFVYPSGLVHRALPDSTNGILYVASANFDRCFDQGTVMAVDLDQVGLPALGTPPSSQPLRLEQLNISQRSRVFIHSYAGEMGIWYRPPDKEGNPKSPRLFVPAREEGDFVHYIDIPEPTRLTCADAPERDDCLDQGQGAVSLAKVEGKERDLPRAPSPFGLDVTSEGDVWVTHLDPADSPAQSRAGFQSYLAHLNGSEPSVTTSAFIPLATGDLPVGGSHSVEVAGRYVFVSGRSTLNLQTTQARPFLVRVLDTNKPGLIIDPALDFSFAAREARGLALTERNPTAPSSPQRLYVAVRAPDSLLIVNVQGLESDLPRLTVVGAVPMPDGPTQVKLVPRGSGRSELVVVSCSAAGVVAIYDPDVGQVVAQVPVGERRGDVDSQPFGLAVQQQGNAARIFVSNFGDGRVSVIDIPELGSPQLARLVAWLGARQDQEGSTTCQEAQQ